MLAYLKCHSHSFIAHPSTKGKISAFSDGYWLCAISTLNWVPSWTKKSLKAFSVCLTASGTFKPWMSMIWVDRSVLFAKKSLRGCSVVQVLDMPKPRHAIVQLYSLFYLILDQYMPTIADNTLPLVIQNELRNICRLRWYISYIFQPYR